MAAAPERTTADASVLPSQSTSTKPFRFKKRHQNSPSHSASDRRRSASPSTTNRPPHRRHHHHHHHHRTRRPPHTPVDDPTLCDDAYLPNSKADQYMDPDVAFRESLFDALADDEGALYWEGVYGQPIHTYSAYKPSSSSPTSPSDPDHPHLERMSDEEYVNYVRSKMWEKTHQSILEERRKREEERREKREREEQGRKWQAGVEEALRRGEERRKREGEKREREAWRGVWRDYCGKWDTTFSTKDEGSKAKDRKTKDCISWPVESGKWRDVCKEEVERFFQHVAEVEGLGIGEVLKKERVRWHPDKMQQRAGTGGMDGETMKLVTAVFQIVDRIWSETRGKA